MTHQGFFIEKSKSVIIYSKTSMKKNENLRG